MKKKLLILAYEYYPTENANTRIIRNTCELLAERFDIDLVTAAAPMGTDPNGAEPMTILRVPVYSFHQEKCSGKLTPLMLGRMFYEKFRGRLEHDETRMLERLYERGVRKAVRLAEYDAVISFSAPILAHGCASRMVRGTKTPWLAVCFDPYFDHLIFGAEGLEARKQREEKYMEPADTVMVMFPTDRDYLQAGVAFGDKILSFDVPGIVPQETQAAADPAADGSRPIRCGFFGSMYREIRDPRAAIALFDEVCGDPDIETVFAGSLEGESAAAYFPEGCRVHYAGVLKGKELAEAYDRTDVLINIGNSVLNQMPSKIFEYISSGKPIINVFKSPDCPTLKYLTRYPLALNLFEGEITEHPAEKAAAIRAFCRETRGKRVPAEEIQSTFAANTFEAFADTIAKWVARTGFL